MTTLETDLSVSAPAARRQRKRVLVSAYAVSPIRGSEPGVGWNVAARLARYHDVTLMCAPGRRDPHRREIEAHLKEHGPVPGLTMLYVDPPQVLRFLDLHDHPLLKPLYYAAYASWQRAAYRRARQFHARQPFDLTHHLNIVGYREPGHLWKLPIPFFWGPVGGASNMPWRFFGLLGWRERAAYGLRNIVNEVQKRISLRPRRAARKAVHIWAIGQDNRRMFRQLYGVDAELLCEVGGAADPRATARSYNPAVEPLRLVWAGYMVGRKALPILLHALAAIDREFAISLRIVGEGPAQQEWQALASRLGIADLVHWVGKLPHEQALAEMSRAHVFAFPSLQEASATVTLEALSLGLPVICHNACGMGFVVNEQCGIRVPMVDPQTSIEGFAQALRNLHRNPAELSRLSRGALERSAELSWDNNARIIAETYDRVLAERRRRR